MPFVYANTSSGLNAGGIGWFNFGSGFTLTPGAAATSFTGTLRNGVTVSFNMGCTFVSGTSTNFTAVTAPANANAYFGAASGGYTGLSSSNVVLQTDVTTGNMIEQVNLTNIAVTDANGNSLPNYTLVVAIGDSISTTPTGFESTTLRSNGGIYKQLTLLGNTNTPTINISSGQTNISGNADAPNSAYVLTTQSPTTAQFEIQIPEAGFQQGVAIGFAVTQLELYKTINGRISASDQFRMNIGGTPASQVTTTGTANGLQPIFSTLSAIPDNVYSIDESMAAGSASALSAYTQSVTAVNLTPGGTTPTVGTLPESITPALGDMIQYTITNTPKPVVTKSVTPAYAQPGDLIKYTVSVFNPNAATAMANTVVTDITPAGTTYVGNLSVSVPYGGTNPAGGITLTSIAPLATATMSWFVQADNVLPGINPIPNFATVTLSDGGTLTTNTVTTQINRADLTAIGNFEKTASPEYASPGDTVTYTLTITNTGNVPANKVVINDPTPAGTTYVAGSITGSIPFTGTPDAGLALISPILGGATATFSFRVTLSGSAPAINPIPNTATVAYSFTVDPAVPDGVTGFGESNNAPVTVSRAALILIKTASKFVAYLNDVINYSLSVTNRGNVSANNVVITDTLPYGLTYTIGSMISSVPVTGDPNTAITLTNPIAAGQTVNITFLATVTAIPNPNPLENVATARFTYTIDPAVPNGVTGNATSNGAGTTVFTNNYSQQVSDLVNSVAQGETALGVIANAEGAKIQRFAAMPDVTPQTLLCVNKSVTDMANTMTTLESILMQKLSTSEGQINGGSGC